MDFYGVLNRCLLDHCETFVAYYDAHEMEEEFRETLERFSYGNQDATGGQEHAKDYQKKYIQDLYALRYMYAYAYEYKGMFHRLLAEQQFAGGMKVLSVGCGNGIDFWALQKALADADKQSV